MKKTKIICSWCKADLRKVGFSEVEKQCHNIAPSSVNEDGSYSRPDNFSDGEVIGCDYVWCNKCYKPLQVDDNFSEKLSTRKMGRNLMTIRYKG